MKNANEKEETRFAKNLGRTIRDLRKERGLSQMQLGEALYAGQDTISLWELGKRLPDVMAIVAMAEFFGVSADYLLGLERD